MLKGYTPPNKSVAVPGNDPLVLRGLSLNDINFLVTGFKPEIMKVFKQFDGLIAGKGMENLDLGTLVVVVFESAPPLAAAIIAVAADEADEATAVMRLPISVQLEAIKAIGDLTFQGEGGAKNVAEAVLKMIGGVQGLVTSPLPKRAEITIGKDGMPTSGPG